MTSRSKPKLSLDTLIRATLRSSVAELEPSPDVWKRIEHQAQRLTDSKKTHHDAGEFEPGLRPRYLHT